MEYLAIQWINETHAKGCDRLDFRMNPTRVIICAQQRDDGVGEAGDSDSYFLMLLTTFIVKYISIPIVYYV